MVRCIRGRAFDVIVDLRKESPSFLKWVGVELSAEQMNMVYIPEGFAHGFQTLTDDCELVYNHTQFYVPDAEGGLKYNDKAIGIVWPLEVAEISERDNNYPALTGSFKGI